jgi:FAD/FMN-containing dehydrogenase
MLRKTDPLEIASYLKDASNKPDGFASAVVIPENETELRQFLKENTEAITLSGAGTGLTAGRTPQGGVVVSMERFLRLLIREDACVEAGAGVTLKDLQNQLQNTSWFYPPNPTENLASLGGNFATNASGSRSYKFGVTRDYVQKADILLSDGRKCVVSRGDRICSPLKLDDGSTIVFPQVSYLSPQCKNATGFFVRPNMDWLDLFIGSGGTLGIVTEITLKTAPKPNHFLSGILFFDEDESLWKLVRKFKEADIEGISPCSLEYFDFYSLEMLRSRFETIPDRARAALFFEQDIYGDDVYDNFVERWFDFLESEGVNLDDSWISQNERDVEKFHDFRHALPSLVNEELSRNNSVKVGTDMAAPFEYFEDMMRFYKRELSASNVKYVVFGHIGDNHLHINFFPEKNTKGKIAALYQCMVNQVLAWGGTISAEHGIGKLKKQYFHQMAGEQGLADMKIIKSVFDSKGLLGQGNMF